MRKLYSGNEAIALGAFEGGVVAAFGYPGTPSTEILENLVKYPGVYCEWSPNEKVALEAAAGAAIAGARAMVTMKLVGLNVAADPLMTLAYIGVVGGLVVCVADDPGQHSSQTEQDTRHYARLAKIPVLEPANAAESRDFMIAAFEISEKYRCPVILRTTTCVSHSRMPVEPGPVRERRPAAFQPNPPQFVPLPVWGRKLRVKVEDRLVAQAQEASVSPLNRTLPGTDSRLGIVTMGVTALHAREIFPEFPILKIGWGFPFPDELFRRFAAGVDEILVIEEGDPILEEHIRSLGIACLGKDGPVPRCGELTPARLFEIRARWEQSGAELPGPVAQAADLPARPPVFCPGCPHRALFYALTGFDVIVSGDIGCYSLGVFPPLNRTDTILCMGAGFTLAHGMEKAGEKRKIVGILGDSTFFHSGITGLLDIVYNRGCATYIVVDNSITAMTGHQDHPGTGVTLMGQPTRSAKIEDIARACGVERVFVCDPFDQKRLRELLKTELETDAPSLIISRSPCPLHQKNRLRAVRVVDSVKCRNCGACLKCGCPAIAIAPGEKPRIERAVCGGCTLCETLCRFGAIAPEPSTV